MYTIGNRGCNFFTHMFKNGLHRLYKELKLIHVIIILKGTSPQQLHDSFNRMISSSAIHTKSISWQKGSGRPSKKLVKKVSVEEKMRKEGWRNYCTPAAPIISHGYMHCVAL